MRKAELIKELDKKYLENHNKFEYYVEQYKYSNDEISSKLMQSYASKSCLIAEILAMINDTNEDIEHERLYNKFKLWKKD